MVLRSSKICIGLIVVLLQIGCSDGNDTPNVRPQNFSYDEQGPYSVGNRTISVLNSVEGRVLDVEIWFPAEAHDSVQSILDFSLTGVERSELELLLADVPESCTRRDTVSSSSVEPLARSEKFPLVILSHCYECTRYSMFTLAERMASHGIVVASPDHAMNTLFDPGALINTEFLATRANDVVAVLDEMLLETSQSMPESLRGRIDASRVGMAGHSFGAVTAGKVLQDDARFKAGMIIAAPVESPVLPGVAVAEIAEPLLFMIAEEDNSIGVLGNAVLRINYEAAVGPAWKIELADAGHWSFSDIAGIVPAFAAGCGEGERQTVPGEPFTYIDNLLARDITAAYGVRFFAAHLLGDEAALEALGQSTQAGVVDVQSR